VRAVRDLLAVAERLDFARTIGIQRIGRSDPTTTVGPVDAVLARWTPDGPGTVCLTRREGTLGVEAWGAGGDWLAARAAEIAGLTDHPPALVAHHRAVADAERRTPGLRLSRLALVHPALVAAVLAQRVTSLEAVRQWAALCRADATAAPGPFGLLLPPHPERLAERPYWWYHRFGIERRRADTLRAVSRRADRLEAAAGLDGPAAEVLLRRIPGVGVWTAAQVRTALGDPDAVAVGDYHLRNIVAYALAGRPRGTDDELLALLAPYTGQRGRVIRLLLAAGWSAPAFGPRRAIPPIASW
jgi:3-methyladenine DNA glycosylase/8-oxoguanine DNA glycosylase